jgi:hypothetical protein
VRRVPVYVSGATARSGELQDHARELEMQGFDVVSSWLWRQGSRSASEAAAQDLADLRRSEVLIAFTQGVGHENYGRGGRHVELGVALSLEIPVVLIGPREHIFHELEDVYAARDWRSARERLERLAAPGGPSVRSEKPGEEASGERQ